MTHRDKERLTRISNQIQHIEDELDKYAYRQNLSEGEKHKVELLLQEEDALEEEFELLKRNAEMCLDEIEEQIDALMMELRENKKSLESFLLRKASQEELTQLREKINKKQHLIQEWRERRDACLTLQEQHKKQNTRSYFEVGGLILFLLGFGYFVASAMGVF